MFELPRPASMTIAGLGRSLHLAAAFAAALAFAPSLARDAAAAAPQGFADVAEQALPAYVDIIVRQRVAVRANPQAQQQQQQGPFDQFFRDFFDQLPNAQPTERAQQGVGSGFIVDKSGIVVTNNHVIAEADEVTVILHDGTRLLATVLGKDERGDLAVLKVDAGRELPALRWGDSDTARIGDWVLAVGNPLGQGRSVSVGIISARARNIGATQYDDLIQTDAAINRGNSGGPLLNGNGEVVGVNIAILSPTGNSIGIGFSIPANMAKPIVQQIVEYGRPRRGWLGVRVQTVTDELAQSLGIGRARGALIGGVSEGGPASKGGILQGDVVLKFAGKEVADMAALPRIVAETPVDQTVDVIVARKGETKELKVKVGELTDTAVAALSPPPPAAGTRTETLGMSLTALTPELRQQYNVASSTTGVLVTGVTAQTDAALRRIQPGDVILEVAQKEVQSPEQVLQLVEQTRADNRGSVLILLRQRNGEMRFVALSLERG
jgi:serine protease Do